MAKDGMKRSAYCQGDPVFNEVWGEVEKGGEKSKRGSPRHDAYPGNGHCEAAGQAGRIQADFRY